MENISISNGIFFSLCVCFHMYAPHILISMVCLHVHLTLFKITATYNVICYINNPFVPVTTFFQV